jgi:hypothetical protein
LRSLPTRKTLLETTQEDVKAFIQSAGQQEA